MTWQSEQINVPPEWKSPAIATGTHTISTATLNKLAVFFIRFTSFRQSKK
jgi:hypothetical protein